MSNNSRTEGKAILHFDAVTKTFRDGPNEVTVLDGLHLNVQAGEMVAITGRSGSGKSTLLNIAGGLEQPTFGTVSVKETQLGALSPHASSKLRLRTIGYVFQNLNLIPTLAVAQNVAVPLELDGMKPKDAQEKAMNALRRIEAEDLAGRTIDNLSGGQRQRVAIARAIVGERSLILADEPTGALDDFTARSIMELLANLADEGAAVVTVTHDAELAAHASRIVRLRSGKIETVTERSAS